MGRPIIDGDEGTCKLLQESNIEDDIRLKGWLYGNMEKNIDELCDKQ